jgi:phosphoglycolate phosphatase
MVDLLDSLKHAGYLLAIETGKSRAGLDSVLAETGVADYFVLTKSGEETACKPDPLMLQQIVDALGTTVADALMVGDSVTDMIFGKRVGMKTVFIAQNPAQAQKHPRLIDFVYPDLLTLSNEI